MLQEMFVLMNVAFCSSLHVFLNDEASLVASSGEGLAGPPPDPSVVFKLVLESQRKSVHVFRVALLSIQVWGTFQSPPLQVPAGTQITQQEQMLKPSRHLLSPTLLVTPPPNQLELLLEQEGQGCNRRAPPLARPRHATPGCFQPSTTAA